MISKRPANFERLSILGETVIVRYDPGLTNDGKPVRGLGTWEPSGPWKDASHSRPYRQVIWLREWDERVFLHEVLHVLLGKHYPNGRHAYDHSFIEDPEHEKAVRTMEDGLWDMGWRLLDGHTTVDPDSDDRNAKPELPA